MADSRVDDVSAELPKRGSGKIEDGRHLEVGEIVKMASDLGLT